MNLSNLLGSVRKKTFAASAVRPARRRPRLSVTTLEARDVPSTLPAPVIDRTSIKTLNQNGDNGMGYSPSLAVDPTNPNRLVSFFIRTEADNGATNKIVPKFSNNGGQSWFTKVPNANEIADLGFNSSTGSSSPTGVDPKASDPANNVIIPYTRVGNPQMAFDRFSNVYVVYGEYNNDNTSGRIVLRRFQFTGTDLVENLPVRTIYTWVDADEAYNPTVAIDTGIGSFIDPDTTLGVAAVRTQSDQLALRQTSADTTRVFVAWNTRNIQPANGSINPNVIRMAVSDNGGLDFGPNGVVNDSGNDPTAPQLAQPKIVFTQGRSGEPSSGGNMVILWSVLNTNFPTLNADTRQFLSPTATTGNLPFVEEITGANAVAIADAVDPGNSAPHIPATSIYPLGPNPADITKIDNISIAVNIQHDDLAHVRIELLPPHIADTGTGFVLTNNRVNAAGTDFGAAAGITGTGLGRYKGAFNMDTIFQDSASRSIQDTGAASPFSGEYRPMGGNMNSFFGALTPTQLANTANGGWRLKVTDFRDSSDGNTNPPPRIVRATLKVARNITDDSDPNNQTALRGFEVPTGARTNLNNFEGRNFATKPTGNATNGVGAGLAVAVDNSFGAYSPYQNRIYIAYNQRVNGQDRVQVRYSDDMGVNWSATTTVGAGFTPQLAVDQTTGTLAVAYYSTQFDQAGVRAAIMLATSIDGGAWLDPSGLQFNTPTPVNPQETYYDQIRQKVMDFEPITSNGITIGAPGYGENLGLVAFNGRVNLLHAGNWNENGAPGTALENNFVRIRTQNLTIAAGPRVISGEQGPVLANAQITELVQNVSFGPDPNDPYDNSSNFTPGNTIAFNNTFDPVDGHRKFSGFVVTFDRVIDPATFTAADVIVKYRDPDDDPSTGGADIPASDITIQRLDFYKDPLDASDLGSRRFLIKVNTQSVDTVAPYRGVGTYSYAIKGDIQDRVRGQSFQTNLGSPTTFSYTGPSVNIADAIPPLTTPTDVPLGVDFSPANPIIGNLTVKVRITHPDVSQLRLELVNPGGFSVPLVLAGDVAFDPDLLQADFGSGTGASTQFTAFDDAAADTIATTADVAPFVGTYRPADRLAQFAGGNANGTWRLRVTDTVQNQVGQVNRWQLIVTPAVTTVVSATGNKVDQDQDGQENEVKPFPGVQDDWFAVPTPLSGAPFQQTYQSGSLPIIVTGPRLIASEPLGANGSEDNIALNQNVTALDVQFDRLMDADTFTVDDVLRITGPLGDIARTSGTTSLISVAPISGFGAATTLAAGTDSKFFRITFLQQKLSGSYRVQLGADIADVNGLKLDSDGDAGVENLKGEAVGSTLTLEQKTYGGTALNIPLPANTTVTVPLQVNDSYSIRRALATISIVHPHTRELEGRLVSPDGTTSVLLFINSPASGSDDAQTVTSGTDPDLFTNITFSDTLPGTPIQNGGATNGTYNPVQPLSQLIGTPSNGQWKLVIRNKGANPGSVRKFELKFDKPAITNGLGEQISDQTSAGFHIFQSNGNDATARNNWTAVGPIGTSSVGTVGRVSAVTVDPSDPSGNTVYAAGASGGVWRTTNFLTRNPLGPNWVPLTDFGPNGAINVGSIAIYPDLNNDPLKTTILVGTGSDSLNQLTYDSPNAQQYNFNGVGFLLSTDAGKTWRVLDSTSNTTTFGGSTWRLIGDAGRDHRFVGAVVNKVVFEPTRNSTNQFPIAYAAVGRGSAAAGVEGLYRSLDGGRTWQQITLPDTGDVMDFVLGAGSAPVAADQTLERTVIGYLTIKGQGVYRSVNLNSNFPSFTKMLGGGGRPTVSSGDVGTDAPVRDPNGANGKIALASPAFVPGNPLANTYYQSWLYAAVSKANGDFDGLYVTKDAGTNWTKVRIMSDTAEPLFTHSSSTNPGGGNHSLAVAVDPLNPNIVYLGSDQIVRVDTTFINDPYNLSLYQYSNPDGGAIRPLTNGGAQVDDRLMDDGVANNSSAPPDDTNSGLRSDDPLRGNRNPFDPPLDSMAPVSFGRELEPEFRRQNRFQWNHLNLARDPYQPFFRDTTLTTFNVLKFLNTGEDVRSAVVADGDRDFVSIANITTGIDPLTGKARILYGTDNGIGTFVQNDAGGANVVPGFVQPYIPVPGLGAQTALPGPTQPAASANLQVNGLRNGDIQVARLYDGDVQPSLLAANIANALTYGVGRRLLDVAGSPENILSSGNANWYNPLGAPPTGPRIATANGVLTDKLGDGQVFILRRINDMPNMNSGGYPNLDVPPFLPNPGEFRTDFFQVQTNGARPISRTGGANSLFRNPADANGTNSQWDNTVRAFAVSQYNRQSIVKPDGQVDKTLRADTYGIVLGSAEGNVYRTQNSGIDWFLVGASSIFNDSPTTALEFGAPIPNANNPRNDNDHIYVGTEEGRIWVTEFGGVATTNWKEISAGLDGERILKIIANPLHGTREAYAVTEHGVFHMRDWSATGATWEEITGNLPTINHTAFYDQNQWTNGVLIEPATPANTEATLTTIAIDWRPTYAATVGKPVLYVGGEGGVFKATESGTATTWIRYPANATDGGLASTPGGGLPVVKVTDLDLSIGNVDPQTGKVSSTGVANVLVATTLGRGTWAVSLGDQGVTGGSGPRVISSTPTFANAGPTNPQPALDKLLIKFDKYIEPASFTRDDVKVVTPAGATLPTSAYTLTNQAAATDNSSWLIDFVDDPTTPGINESFLSQDGTYTITVGPNITDGPASPSFAGNKMNQDSDGINGEDPADAFKFSFTVGVNDLTDYVRDVYTKILGREPTAAELAATNVKSMDAARATALSTVAKELLMTFNANEARKGLVDRLFKTTGGANLEIGNLLPTGYTLLPADRDALVAKLVNGTTTPERLIVEIMTGMASTTAATTIPGLGQTYYTNATAGQVTPEDKARAYLTKVYQDVFRHTPTTSRLQFSWLPAATQTQQLTQVDTPAERFTFVNNLVRTLKAVQFYEGGVVAAANLKTIYARDWFIRLAYAKYLNRAIDPATWDQAVTSAEITAGRSLLATLPAANQLQTLERLYQKLLGSKEFFSLQTQVGGPDNGLHTDRSWVDGVFKAFVRRGTAQNTGGAPTTVEVNTYSQKVLDLFETQRTTFINGILNSNEYKDQQADKYYQMVFGRVATTAEKNSWRTSLANGATYANLVAGLFGSTAFFNSAPTVVGGGSTASQNTWARAVLGRAFGTVPPASDPAVLALETRANAVGRTRAALELVINSDQFRNKVIDDMFLAALGRAATTAEKDAYRAFLASTAGANHWERILRDILAQGNVVVAGQTVSLQREFWEIAG